MSNGEVELVVDSVVADGVVVNEGALLTQWAIWN